MLTLTHPIQLVPSEDHAGNTQRPPHIHLHWRQAHKCNLQFTSDNDLTGGSNGELHDLTNRLVGRARAHGMEVSTEKSKIMTNSMNNISVDMSMNHQKLEEVTSFKYLQATLCKVGTCSAEIHFSDLVEQHHQL